MATLSITEADSQRAGILATILSVLGGFVYVLGPQLLPTVVAMVIASVLFSAGIIARELSNGYPFPISARTLLQTLLGVSILYSGAYYSTVFVNESGGQQIVLAMGILLVTIVVGEIPIRLSHDREKEPEKTQYGYRDEWWKENIANEK